MVLNLLDPHDSIDKCVCTDEQRKIEFHFGDRCDEMGICKRVQDTLATGERLCVTCPLIAGKDGETG